MFASTGLRARRGYMILRDHFRVGWIIIWSQRFEHEQRCMFLRSHLRDGLLPSSRSSVCAAVALDDCCFVLPDLCWMILWIISSSPKILVGCTKLKGSSVLCCCVLFLRLICQISKGVASQRVVRREADSAIKVADRQRALVGRVPRGYRNKSPVGRRKQHYSKPRFEVGPS